jgi:chromosome segregation ATPase
MEIDEARVTDLEDNDEEEDDNDNESTVSRIREDESESSQTISPPNRPLYSDEQAMERLAQERARKAKQPRNQVAENAIIEEVTCVNFMCHSSLNVKLGPLINFIIGHNGSGKSAVLTALIICLGGKASATSRGNNLKAFIKEGTEKCTLRVQIKNQGRSAYKPEVFGNSIIVERHFSRSGTSGFNIRNANNKSVSTTRADVDDILDYFALQLDNPMNVLTQDQARAFLNSASNKDKYRFFSKGTQLEQLDNDYQNMEDLCTKLELNMDLIQGQVDDLKQRLETARKNSQTTASMRKLNDELNRLRTQMCWIQVEAQERALQDSQTKIEDCETYVETAKREFEETSRAHTEIAKQKDDADSRI